MTGPRFTEYLDPFLLREEWVQELVDQSDHVSRMFRLPDGTEPPEHLRKLYRADLLFHSIRLVNDQGVAMAESAVLTALDMVPPEDLVGVKEAARTIWLYGVGTLALTFMGAHPQDVDLPLTTHEVEAVSIDTIIEEILEEAS